MRGPAPAGAGDISVIQSNAERDRTRRLLSILCVTYNHAEFAAQGLQSIFAQSHRDIEIVVLDDGSTDDNVSVVKAALATSPFPCKLIEQQNSGNVPQNYNRARAAASGDFIGFLSLDDRFKPDFAESHLRALTADPQVALSVDTVHDIIDHDGAVTRKDVPMPAAQRDIAGSGDLLECELENLGAFYIQSSVLRADLFDAVGGFDEDMTGDDIILRTKVLRHLSRTPDLHVRLNRGVGFEYRLHGDNLHRDNFRQVKTVVEWRNRYFPDRPLPQIAENWIRSYVNHTVFAGEAHRLAPVRRMGEDIAGIIDRYMRTPSFRRHRLKAALRRGFGRLRR